MAETETVTEVVEVEATPTELLASTPEVESMLAVEEEIERRTANDSNDTPHFRKDVD